MKQILVMIVVVGQSVVADEIPGPLHLLSISIVPIAIRAHPPRVALISRP